MSRVPHAGVRTRSGRHLPAGVKPLSMALQVDGWLAESVPTATAVVIQSNLDISPRPAQPEPMCAVQVAANAVHARCVAIKCDCSPLADL